MKFKITRIDGGVAFECDAETTSEALRLAVEAGANLARASLTRANLAGADLAGANLAGASLTRANLAGADLAGANLARANLAGANLAGADLAGANLAGANLARANLAGANLAGADLAGANLAGAYGVICVGPADGWMVYAVRHPDGPRIKAGCQWFTLAEAREYWANKPDREQLLRAVNYLAAEAQARGWEMPT